MSVRPFSHTIGPISETDASRITKFDTEMFHRESWKPVYFGVKRSKGKITRHKDIAAKGHCAVVNAGFCSRCIVTVYVSMSRQQRTRHHQKRCRRKIYYYYFATRRNTERSIEHNITKAERLQWVYYMIACLAAVGGRLAAGAS